jgi:hypothetical protein
MYESDNISTHNSDMSLVGKRHYLAY